MATAEQLPDWYDEDVVCVALVPAGQLVDWGPGSYEPDEAAWPPQGTFERLQIMAARLGLPIFVKLNIYEQARLGPDECRAALAHWEQMERAVERTPGAGWVAAIGLILQRCVTSPGTEVLIEGP